MSTLSPIQFIFPLFGSVRYTGDIVQENKLTVFRLGFGPDWGEIVWSVLFGLLGQWGVSISYPRLGAISLLFLTWWLVVPLILWRMNWKCNELKRFILGTFYAKETD